MRDNVSSGALTETSLLILLSLFKELHGYGIKQLVEEKTQGRVILGMGTLYGAINNMEQKSWIKQSSKDGNRINYLITEAGKAQVLREEERLREVISLIEELKEDHYEKN
ncbi:PadR family transcriptional regulator [Facklamia miroungae]|uniref:DNA-binding transcriptional regulator, PadR family n=1 Tax=Facklamia miroungae TaxID=120956 RepID=A0A1G7QCC9_9LACT|nr:helix-turn-helix transcriptional regulator [Facklamia miroungae]NKZ28897.1 PadR family transcriptional regulator [Facklamia miroungae]SDF96144.1 DNA-binding transcriptional regulator, PadR family [Facklamia miroungae]